MYVNLKRLQMAKQIKRYMIDEIESELTAVSLVDLPAIESDFQYFNKQDSKRYVQLENEEKRLVIGAALVPDLDIYRYDQWSGEEYYISFSKKCIEKLADKFMKNNLGHNWSLDHEQLTDGVYVFESWIKADMEKDKSVALGIDPSLPVGTWFLSARINDNELWDKVKAGVWHGFSVEAFCVLDELNFNKHNKMDKKETFFEKLKNIFAEVFESEEDTKVDETLENAEEQVALEEVAEPEEVENAEVEPEAVELEEEQPAEEPVELEEEKAEEETVEEIEVKQNLETDELNTRIADLEDKVAKLLERNAELQKQNEKLSAQPSAKPINAKSEKKQDVMDIIRSLHDGTYGKK